MKTLKLALSMLLLISGAESVYAQSYPPDPTIAQISAAIKNDEAQKEILAGYGYDPSVLQRGTFRMATKAELKNYYFTKWYWRSDYAYKISLNENYNDRLNFSVFLDVPKDAQGVSHKIFFSVGYTRMTEDYFEDNKWSYYYANLDPIECETYGIPKLNDNQRKQLMIDYIEANKATNEVFRDANHPVNNIFKIDSVFAYSHHYAYFKTISATQYHWALTVLAEYTIDKEETGGAVRVAKDYINIPFTATYSGGKYTVKPESKGWVQEYRDTYAPGFTKLYDNGTLYDESLSESVWYETLANRTIGELLKQSYKKSEPAESESFIEKRMTEFGEAIKSMESGDAKMIKQAILPFMNPSRAEELATSYAKMAEEWKVETLHINSAPR
jgi:hypothetical protein